MTCGARLILSQREDICMWVSELDVRPQINVNHPATLPDAPNTTVVHSSENQDVRSN